MTEKEAREKLKPDDYVELYYQSKNGYRVRATGKIRYISTDGDVVFSHNDYRTKVLIRPKDIIEFIPKEMLPPPTEYKGEPVTFMDGDWIIIGKGESVDFGR